MLAKKRIDKIKKLVIFSGILTLLNPFTVTAQKDLTFNQRVKQVSPSTGNSYQWIKIHKKWYYQNSKGFFETGWEKINGKWYYLNPSGVMQTGWEKINGKWYYLNPSGAMQTGWKQLNGKWYYLNPSGVMQTGWKQLKEKWYYLNPSGVMQTGWEKINGKWYYLNPSGAMQTGWKQLKEKWYYLNPSGAMQTGWKQLNGNWYYLNSSGVMQTGWLTLGDKKYHLAKSGKWLETINTTKPSTSSKEFNLEKFNEEFLFLVNRERKTLSLKLLSYDPRLQKGANIRANEMAAVNEISHTRPNGEAFWTAFNDVYDQPKYYLGENVAYRSVCDQDLNRLEKKELSNEKLFAEKFYNQYFHSPGHYQNMIRKDYKKMAVGISQFEGRLFNAMIFSK